LAENEKLSSSSLGWAIGMPVFGRGRQVKTVLIVNN